MGYRWYDSQNIEPLFPFGFGLSYTEFRISYLEVSPRTIDGTQPVHVEFWVENTGQRAGAEVPQVYLGLPSAASEPPKRLAAFQKVWLQPGEKKRIQLTIDPAATSHPFDIWDAAAQQWITPDGSYQVYTGSSSANASLLSDSIAVRIRSESRPHTARLGRHKIRPRPNVNRRTLP